MDHSQPKHLLLQWHITDRCNLRCQHCYQENYQDKGPEFGQLLDILDQYELLLSALSTGRKRLPGQITITGGEPFVRDDFLHLLMEIKRRRIPFAILTNGSLIDLKTARFLKALAPVFIQVSLEGEQERHDAIRGAGDHARVVETLVILKKAGLKTLVSFTAHRDNYDDFPAVAVQCRKSGVGQLWSDRLIPSNPTEKGGPGSLSPGETQAFFGLMQASTKQFKGVAMHRALQFLVNRKQQPYRCEAGHALITIMPDGAVVPCRRLPIPVGNLFESSLTKIYFESKLLQDLRDPTCVAKGCESCIHQRVCGGGLRCLAYAVSGDPFRADPGCWLAAASPTTSAAASTPAASTSTTARAG